MNLYIMTDSEGISGIYSREQVMGDRIPEGRAFCASLNKKSFVNYF